MDILLAAIFFISVLSISVFFLLEGFDRKRILDKNFQTIAAVLEVKARFSAIPHEFFQWGIGVIGRYKERDIKCYYWFELGLWLRCTICMIPLQISEKLKSQQAEYVQLTTRCGLRNAKEVCYKAAPGKEFGKIIYDKEAVIAILEELRKITGAVESGLFEEKIIKPSTSTSSFIAQG